MVLYRRDDMLVFLIYPRLKYFKQILIKHYKQLNHPLIGLEFRNSPNVSNLLLNTISGTN